MEETGNTNMHPTPGMAPEKGEKHSSAGPIVGTVIIIVVIVLGGLYFWGKRLAEAPTDEQTEELQDVSTSDSVADIEADLNATDLDSLDSDINQLGAEAGASATQQ